MATPCNLHFPRGALNGFNGVPFTRKISIYPDTDGYRADVAIKSRIKEKKRENRRLHAVTGHSFSCHSYGKKSDKLDVRCCLSHLSFVHRASCFNNTQNCIVDPSANIYCATRPYSGQPRINKRRETISRYTGTRYEWMQSQQCISNALNF